MKNYYKFSLYANKKRWKAEKKQLIDYNRSFLTRGRIKIRNMKLIDRLLILAMEQFIIKRKPFQ